jgi:hypothetical protein
MSRAPNCKKKNKAQAIFEELADLNTKYEDEARQTMDRVNQKADALNVEYDEKMKVVRCRTLRIKKLNGGLSIEEETELSTLEK